MTKPHNLPAFVLARITETEADALAAMSNQEDEGWAADGRALSPHVGIIHEPVQMAHIVRHDPWRVLAECKALRAIVGDPDTRGGVMYEYTLLALAGIWSDHPDYQQEWAL